MEQKGFLFDQTYCIGCQTCVSACRARHGLKPGVYPRKATSSQVQVIGPFLSMSCNHCSKPACEAVCPTGALVKREDGIVAHDPDICIGCYSCVAACPYEAPQKNELNSRMVKCDMCAARQDAGDEPACVLACPVKVLSIGSATDFDSEGAAKEAEGFTREDTDPNIRFVARS